MYLFFSRVALAYVKCIYVGIYSEKWPVQCAALTYIVNTSRPSPGPLITSK